MPPLAEKLSTSYSNDVNNSTLKARTQQMLHTNDMRLKRFLIYDSLNYLFLPENFNTSIYASKKAAEQSLCVYENKIKMLNVPPANKNIKIFIKMKGILANVSVPMAKALDNWYYDIPSTGLLSGNWFDQFFAYELISDICNGNEFWKNVKTYSWAWLLFEHMCKISNTNIYFLSEGDQLDVRSWGYNANWIHKNFGDFGINHYIMAANDKNFNLLCHTQTDVLITSSKEHAINWNATNGTSLYFPEIDERSTRAATEVSNRLNVLNVLGHLLKSDLPVV